MGNNSAAVGRKDFDILLNWADSEAHSKAYIAMEECMNAPEEFAA